MQKFYELIQKTKFWAWYKKPRSKSISVMLIFVAALLLIIYVPYVGLIKDFFAIAIGGMGVLNLAGENNALS